MANCDCCGDSGAKYAPGGDVSNGIFCYNCIDFVMAGGGRGECDPRYSDNPGTRELYNTLMSAPNSEYK
jgi:hypothetical protein